MFRKDLQYYKFCLYGFLKNQKFYEPFIFLFLLDKDITYLQIGILYSIREITINILEIPAGLISDSAGRRRSMIISFLFYICSFIVFFFASDYFLLIAAMIIFGFGEVFRTGTHKAMIFDYLKANKWSEHKVSYYGHTRSWSQLGSALSSILAAIIVIASGNYRSVFIIGIIPYLLNLINIASYPVWLDGKQKKFNIVNFRKLIKSSVKSLYDSLTRRNFVRLYLNSGIPGGYFKSVKDYLQALILVFIAGIPLFSSYPEDDKTAIMIGLIYFIIYLLTSWASRRSGAITKFMGSLPAALNSSYLIILSAGIAAGVLYHFEIGIPAILIFIFIFLAENTRRPIAVACISEITDNQSLATFLSLDSQIRSLSAIITGPLIGYLADLLTPGLALSAVAVFLLLLLPVIRLKGRPQS